MCTTNLLLQPDKTKNVFKIFITNENDHLSIKNKKQLLHVKSFKNVKTILLILILYSGLNIEIIF